jgi:hypothetical protein
MTRRRCSFCRDEAHFSYDDCRFCRWHMSLFWLGLHLTMRREYNG